MLRSELLCLEEQLAEAKTSTQRIASVEHFLIGRMTNTEPDKLVLAALAIIHRSRGIIQVSELKKVEKRFFTIKGFAESTLLHGNSIRLTIKKIKK